MIPAYILTAEFVVLDDYLRSDLLLWGKTIVFAAVRRVKRFAVLQAVDQRSQAGLRGSNLSQGWHRSAHFSF